MELTEFRVPVDNGELWADSSQDGGGGGGAGDGGRGNGGLPLVLMHPGIGDSRVWDRIMPRLTGAHRVIRYDVRGYGRSAAPTAAYSLVADLEAVLDHCGVDRAVLVGGSMGGATAINLALDHPERVAGLALVSPGVTGYEGFTSAAFMAELVALAQAGDTDGILALGMRAWAGAGSGADEEAAAAIRGAIPAWFSNQPHQRPDPPAFDRLGELDTPSVLILGERDQAEVVRGNEEMAARIPGCRLVRLPDADHLPMLRAPETVADLVLELAAQARKS